MLVASALARGSCLFRRYFTPNVAVRFSTNAFIPSRGPRRSVTDVNEGNVLIQGKVLP
jgi:hypothetical protein